MPNIPSIKIGNTTYNVKDTTAREHLVEVSTTQPSSPDNRLWIKDAGNEYEIPTYDELTELKSALNDTTDNAQIEFIPNKYIKTSGTSVDITQIFDSQRFGYAIINANANDCFTVTGTGGSDARLWCCIDSNGQVISKAVENEEADKHVILCPENTSKIIIQSAMGSGNSYYGKLINNSVLSTKNILNNIAFNPMPVVNWKQGGYDATGAPVNSNRRIRTRNIDKEKIKAVRSVPGYRFCVYAWNNLDVFLGAWTGNGFTKTNILSYCYNELDLQPVYNSTASRISIVLTKDDNTQNLGEEDGTNLLYTSSCVSGETFGRLLEEFTEFENLYKFYVDRTSFFINGKYLAHEDVGETIDITDTVDNTNYGLLVFPVKKAESITLTGTGANGPRLWLFTDEHFEVLSVSDADVSVSNEKLYADADGYVVINVLIAEQHEVLHTIISEDNAFTDIHSLPIYWENGGISASDGSYVESARRLRSQTIKINDFVKIKCINSYKIGIYGWDGGTYLGYYNGLTFTRSGSALQYYKKTFVSRDIKSAGASIVVLVMSNDDTDESIAPEEAENLIVTVSVQDYTNKIINDINSVVGITKSSSLYDHGPFNTRKGDYLDYYKGLQNSYSVFSSSSKYSDVISAFDSLMAEDPTYITKQSLGYGSGVDAGGNQYTLYEYVFKPKKTTIERLMCPNKMPKVYLDGSIHGFERNSTFEIYYFLKDLVENYDKNPTLMNIRSFVEFHVIPVVNPYGFDRDLYVNANGININRNFAHPNGEWTEILEPESERNGAAAFDQPESAIVRDWLLANENDVLLYLNCHTNGSVTEVNYKQMNWLNCSGDRNDYYFNRLFRVFEGHIDRQTLMIPNMYQEIAPGQNECCGYVGVVMTENGSSGSAMQWASTVKKFLSLTFETFNGLSTNGSTIVGKYSETAQKIASEILGNFVARVLNEYACE